LAAGQSLTASQVNNGAKLLIRPGVITGNGSGSQATPAIQNMGSTSWMKRVLIRPRDGYKSVTINTARFFRVHGFTWAGLITGGIRWDSCINAGMAWIKCNGTPWWNTTDGEPTMTGLHVVEVVRPAAYVGTGDAADCWPGDANIESPIFEGMFFAPGWRAAGSSAHQDTLQFEPFGGTVNNMTFRDNVMFGSRNTALQINALRTALIDHCYIFGKPYCLDRWPMPSGTDGSTAGWAMNGGHGTPALSIKDSAIVGGWTLDTDGGPAVSSVVNTIVNTSYNSKWPGDYRVFTNVNDGNFNSVTGLQRPLIPDKDYQLSSIWTD
jgi:hypothetical protein